MTCSKCSAALADNSRFCANCGNSVLEPQTASPPFAPPPPVPGSVVATQTSGKAIASLICGILMVFPFFILAVIFGHLAISDIRRSAGGLKGQGMAIAGLVLGYSAIPLVLIIAAIAIPNLLRAKISANEASAVGSVRILVRAEISYQTANPKMGFTCKISDLESTGLIGSDLASGQKYGYVFALQNCTAEKEGDPASHFQIIASPITYNQTGIRQLCVDESGVVKSDNSGSMQCVDRGVPLE